MPGDDISNINEKSTAAKLEKIAESQSNVRTDDLLELIIDVAKQVDVLTKLSTANKTADYWSKWVLLCFALLVVIGLFLVGVVTWDWRRVNIMEDRLDRLVTVYADVAALKTQEAEDDKKYKLILNRMSEITKNDTDLTHELQNLEAILLKNSRKENKD